MESKKLSVILIIIWGIFLVLWTNFLYLFSLNDSNQDFAWKVTDLNKINEEKIKKQIATNSWSFSSGANADSGSENLNEKNIEIPEIIQENNITTKSAPVVPKKYTKPVPKTTQIPVQEAIPTPTSTQITPVQNTTQAPVPPQIIQIPETQESTIENTPVKEDMPKPNTETRAS